MLAVLPLIIAGGVMWIVAHQLAPVGYEISLTRAILTIALFGLADFLSKAFLFSAIGDWRLLIDIFVCILVSRSVLRLPWWRSTAVVTVYLIIQTLAFFVIGLVATKS